MKVGRLFTAVFLVPLFFLGQDPGTSSGSTQDRHLPQSQHAEQFLGLASPRHTAEFIAHENHSFSWDKNYLVVFGTGKVKQPITLYDKTGKWLFESWLTVDGAARIFIQDASPTSKGTVAVAASSEDKDGASVDMIVEVGKGGIGRVIRTSPFYSLRLCATDEGTVWAYGVELTDDRRAERGLHYPMLREYSFEKGELRSALDRATVRPPRGVPVDGGPAEEFQMRCGFGKAVLVNGATRELIEYHFSASQLTRWPMNIQPEGYQVNGAALTESGEVYLSACRCGRP